MGLPLASRSGPSLRDRLEAADRHQADRVSRAIGRDLNATRQSTLAKSGLDRGPYEVRGTAGTEVWYFGTLVATYTTQGAAEHLCKLLNGAFALGHAEARESMRKLTGTIVVEATPEQLRSLEAAFNSDVARPLAVIGPGGDFTRDITDNGVSGESAAGGHTPGTGSKPSSEDAPDTGREAGTPRDPARGPIHRPGSSGPSIDVTG